ncbi:hypothetical protein [Dyadobacter sp. CY343]|uniref:hypothetical protein n=1 Tax=Dyadobacter sp. CY343 TaxID=2907299 RepID=UPI001F3EBA83|nr:hypothetical protein [Dyadobacter sp. CY343]MCE7062774.1 hypothetical protein [Dyadobacter sp. CY343]
MKISTILLLTLIISGPAFAQDNAQITYTQEEDTLLKQHFIDRYENVFMTKVSTRHMFKISAGGSSLRGTGINLAYEYKLSPSLSLEAGAYVQNGTENLGLLRNIAFDPNKTLNVWANAKLRWYYQMNQRMKDGLSANNFSGAYFGLSYEKPVITRSEYGNRGAHEGRIGLLYGFQSRFFNSGFVDFAVGVFEGNGSPILRDNLSTSKFRNTMIATQFNVGLAFGDWKRSDKTPTCDILRCDEQDQDQWKVQLPDLVIGLKYQRAALGIAYERKIGKSAFSYSAYANANYHNDNYYRFGNVTTGVSLRHYFLQKHQMLRGKTGNSFSGVYWAASAAYDWTWVRSQFYNEQSQTKRFDSPMFSLALGYQQRLFKRLYFDVSAFYNRSTLYGKPNNFFSSKMSLGMTF